MHGMNSIRKMNNSRFIIKGQKEQQLCDRELLTINSNQITGILHWDISRFGSSFTLSCDFGGLIPMDEFLQMNTLSKRMFSALLKNIMMIIKTAEKMHFNRQLFVLLPQYTMIEPSSWHVFFLYIPIQPYTAEGTLKDLLLSIVQYSNFDSSEDTSYVQEYIRIISAEVNFSTFILEEFIQFLDLQSTDNVKANTNNQCPICKSKLESNEALCPYCGNRLNTTASIENKNTSKSECLPHLYTAPSDNADENENLMVNADENGVVTVFRASKTMTNRSAEIYSQDGAVKVQINKVPFRIGKLRDGSDYRICDETISRKHADIIKEQGKFYLIDLNSTNGTFLNGRKLQCGMKEELKSGDQIRFATHCYYFYLN